MWLFLTHTKNSGSKNYNKIRNWNKSNYFKQISMYHPYANKCFSLVCDEEKQLFVHFLTITIYENVWTCYIVPISHQFISLLPFRNIFRSHLCMYSEIVNYWFSLLTVCCKSIWIFSQHKFGSTVSRNNIVRNLFQLFQTCENRIRVNFY